MPRPVLEARGVTVRFGHEDVVQDVSLAIEAGDSVGIVGPNGAGKSTLLRAMLGLVPLRAGEVRLFGQALRGFREWPRLGYVPQHVVQTDARLFPATAYEVVLLGRVGRRGLLGRLSARDREQARRALRTVGMDLHADRRLGELSGGQLQRVFLAKALASEPELLVLDEPTTGVDPAARQAFYELLDCLNHEDGLTVVHVSHDTPALLVSAHRIVAINHKVLYDGPPEDLAARGGLPAIYDLAITHAHDHPQDHPREGFHAARP